MTNKSRWVSIFGNFINEMLAKFNSWCVRNRSVIISIALTFITTFIFCLLIFTKGNTYVKMAQENVKEAKHEVEKVKKDAQAYYNKGIEYKKRNEELKRELEISKNTDRDCYIKFMKQSAFLKDYSDYNDDFYLSNVGFYNSLILYEEKLDSYNNAITRNLHRIILTPMLVTDFNRVGFELNLSIPITSDLLLSGGVGYFNKLYFKVGMGFRL